MSREGRPRVEPLPGAHPLGFGGRDDSHGRPFLNTKIISGKLPATHVLRKRLVDQVAVGVNDLPLTLISGLAGSGKSVLAASWAAQGTLTWPIAWLGVDRSDNQPEEFWTYVIEAMSRCGVVLPHASRSAVVDETFLAWLCVDLLSQRDRTVLVLDHADRLVNPTILHGLDFVLTHAASHFRLLMCCRTDPLLPLNRYRLDQTISEIRGSDLSFTPAEVALLLENHNLTVSAEFADRLLARTGGWPAALGLAAIALQASPDGEQLLSALDASDATTAEYLLTEVLDTQTPELRGVLLRTSVASELWPGLVDELVGHPGGLQTLSAFGHANVFVEQTTAGTGPRRVQPLLREMLHAQLSYEAPQLHSQLHRRCAAWLFEAGQLEAAVEHAVASGHHAYAAEVLVEDLAVCSLLAAGGTPQYAAALDSMPVTGPGPSAALIQAALALTRGDAAASWEQLTRAEANPDPRKPAEVLSAAMLRATLHAEGADVANTLSACAELAALVTPECEKAHPEVPALVAACRGAAELWRGDLDSAEQALAEAADLAAACGARLLRVQCLGRLALLYALRGRYRRAEELGHDAHRLALQGEVGPERHPPAAAIALAWSFTQQYRYAQARHWLEYAERCAIENQRLLLAPVAAVLRSRLGPAGEPTAAIEAMLTQDRVVPVSWMRDLLTAQAVEVELAEGRTDLARGTAASFTESNSIRIRLAQNRVHAAKTPAPPPREALDGAGVPLDLRVDAWLAECAFQLDRGRDDSAVRAYERALELAAPEQLRRPFVHPPPRIRELVCGRVSDEAMSWLRLSPRKRAPGVADERRPESAEQPVPPQPLTMRETEVLRHLAHMLSTQEIGLAMFVSINTVRTHIRSILRKLDVPGRSAAVRRGWELGLISRPD